MENKKIKKTRAQAVNDTSMCLELTNTCCAYGVRLFPTQNTSTQRKPPFFIT